MVQIFCSNCNETFGFDMNTALISKDKRETLIVVCPKCKIREEKHGEKIEIADINYNQINIFNIK